MRRLFLREVRRLAIPAVAIFGLGILLLLLFAVAKGLFNDKRLINVDAAFWVVALGAPWLLGVVAFAPDHETGGEAFLSTLPVSRWKLFSIRALVATGWALAAVVAYAMVVWVFGFGRVLNSPLIWGLAVLVPLTGAPLAAVVVRRTLVAFVTAPLFTLVPLAAVVAILNAFGAPSDFYLVFIPAVVPICLVTCAVTYVKAGSQAGLRRPLLLSAKVLGAGILLVTGITTAGFAHDRLTTVWESGLGIRSADQRLLAADLSAKWSWKRSVASYRLDRERSIIVDAQRPYDPWTLPRGVRACVFSPDGGDLLCWDARINRWHLYDVAERASRGESPPDLIQGYVHRNRLYWPDSMWVYGSSSAFSGTHTWNRYPQAERQVNHLGVVWKGRTPCVVLRVEGPALAVVAWDGSERTKIAGSFHVVAASGPRLVLRKAIGDPNLRQAGDWLVWNVQHGGEPAPLAVSEAGDVQTGNSALEPRGRWFVVMGSSPGSREWELRVFDLEVPGDRGRRLELGMGTQPANVGGPYVSLQFDPTGLRAYVDWSQWTEPPEDDPEAESDYHAGASTIVDLETGRVREFVGESKNTRVMAWAPSGERLSTPDGIWRLGAESIELESAYTSMESWKFSDYQMFVGQELLLVNEEILNIQTGEREACPLQ